MPRLLPPSSQILSLALPLTGITALALPTWPRTVGSVRSLANTAAQCARSSRPDANVTDSLRTLRRRAGTDAFPSRLLVQDSVEVIRERLSQDEAAQGRLLPGRFSSSAGSSPPEAGSEGGAAPAGIPSELTRDISRAALAVERAADSISFAVHVLERLAQMLETATVARQAEPAAEVDVVERQVVRAEVEVPAKAAKTKKTAPPQETTTAATKTKSPQTMEEAIASLRTMVLEKEEGSAEEQPTAGEAEMTEKEKKKAQKTAKALRKKEKREKKAAAKRARLELKRERRKAREEAELRKLQARRYPGSDISTFRHYHEAFRDLDPDEPAGADEEEAEVAAADEDEVEEAAADEEEVEVADADEDEVEVAAEDEEEAEVAAADEGDSEVVVRPMTMGEKRRARNEAAAAKREAGRVRAQERKAKRQAFHAKRAEQKRIKRSKVKVGGADQELLDAAEEELVKSLWPDNDGRRS